jgi:hypothetical protein
VNDCAKPLHATVAATTFTRFSDEGLTTMKAIPLTEGAVAFEPDSAADRVASMTKDQLLARGVDAAVVVRLFKFWSAAAPQDDEGRPAAMPGA